MIVFFFFFQNEIVQLLRQVIFSTCTMYYTWNEMITRPRDLSTIIAKGVKCSMMVKICMPLPLKYIENFRGPHLNA